MAVRFGTKCLGKVKTSPHSRVVWQPCALSSGTEQCSVVATHLCAACMQALIIISLQVGMDARSLAARLPSRRGGTDQMGGRKGQTDRGAKNAQQRRLRAFRQALVRAVVPSHTAFLRQLQKGQQQLAGVEAGPSTDAAAATAHDYAIEQQQQQQQQPPQKDTGKVSKLCLDVPLCGQA